jgi:hypothetical protein
LIGHNTGVMTVNLLNWSLTDDAAQPAKWGFRNLARRIVVFASGKAPHAGAELHTNFKLEKDGEPSRWCNPTV